MGTLRREELGRALIVTLTYPGDFPAPEDHKVYKYHLNKFGTYLRRRWPECSAVWKLEFQVRGAAHYHLMLFGVNEEISKVREWVTSTWGDIAHKGDIHEGRWATNVENVRSIGGAAAYLVKYLGKGDQTMPGNFSGRYWGKINEDWLPLTDPETREVEEKRAYQIKRIAVKKCRRTWSRADGNASLILLPHN
jgi:hypothetical protein